MMIETRVSSAEQPSRPSLFGSHRVLLGGIVVLAIVLAIYALRFVTAVQPGVSHDDAEYLVLAESFATGQPYRLINYPDAPLETTWPPGYPLLILTIPWLLVGPDITLLRILNVLLAGASALVGYRLLRTFADHWIALAAVLLFVLNPRLVGLATLTMSDVAFTFFVLAFLLVFSQTDAGRLPPALGLILSIMLLAAAILIRYWGVAFLGAAVLYLVLRREYRKALAIGAGTLIALSPFLLFLRSQVSTTPDPSFFAISALDRARDFSNFATSLVAYWKATPLVLIPVLGPSAEETLAGLGLAWSIGLIHSIVLLIVGVGFVVSFPRQRFVALAVLCYALLLFLLTGRIDGTAQIFDEPRYLTPVLILLYAYLLLGVQVVAQKVMGKRAAARVAIVLAVALGAVLLLRNIQQSRGTFPVADLSAGAIWAQANTSEDAAFMTPDPVSRYIHLRRYTTPFPTASSDPAAFWTALSRWRVEYVMLAPPLTINRVPNIEQQPDPWIEAHVLPIVTENPRCFTQVFSDDASRTHIYQVIRSCPELKTANE